MDTEQLRRNALAALAILITSAYCGPAGGEVVNFPDPNLEAAVRDELRIPEPTPITTDDMLSIRSLFATGRSIASLEGMQYATNAFAISTLGNQISDLSPLSNLGGLKVLWVDGNSIADLAPVSGLSALLILSAEQNLIADVSPLAGLPNIRTVSLRWNQISDISSLSGLTGLISLDLRGNPLNAEAYSTYLPLIEANNRLVNLRYDPIPEPATVTLLALVGLLGAVLRRVKP